MTKPKPAFFQHWTFVCVARITDGEQMYLGKSTHTAAKNLVPGTTYGKGSSKIAAQKEAAEQVRHFRKVLYNE